MSEVINHKERAHSPIGASSASRWIACPASVSLQEGIAEQSSPYAEEGTVAHELGEWAIEKDLDPVLHWEKFVEETDKPASLEMAQAVQVYYNTIKSIMSKHSDSDPELSLEERFELTDVHPDAFGTNDACIYVPFERMYIIDYKHGAGVPVRAENNKQLLYYALGAIKGMEVEEVVLMIVQPRCEIEGEGYVREWVIPVAKLDEFREELRAAVKRVYAPNPKAVAGDHCKFCKASGFCPALRKEAMTIAQSSFDLIEDKGTVTLPSPSSLSPEQITKVLEGASLVSQWVKDVQSYAHMMAESGKKVAGYKLVAKKGNRKWTNESLVAQEFEDLFADDLFDKKLKSPAQLEKIVGKENVDRLTTRPENGTTLVPEKDKRKAIEVTPASDAFDVIEEDLDL